MAEQTIGIIGAGNMGKGITRRLTAAGHTVLIADHTPEKAVRVAADASAGQAGRASAAEEQDAVNAEIVIVALPYPATVAFAKAHSDTLAAKIVIDIANPLDETYTRLTVPPTTSAAEEVAKAIPASRIVKAFNTLPAPTLFRADVDGVALDVFVASDDAEAKETVLALLDGSALRPLDAGALANARLLERLDLFGIELGQRYGLGSEFGLKYLPTHSLAKTRTADHA